MATNCDDLFSLVEKQAPSLLNPFIDDYFKPHFVDCTRAEVEIFKTTDEWLELLLMANKLANVDLEVIFGEQDNVDKFLLKLKGKLNAPTTIEQKQQQSNKGKNGDFC